MLEYILVNQSYLDSFQLEVYVHLGLTFILTVFFISKDKIVIHFIIKINIIKENFKTFEILAPKKLYFHRLYFSIYEDSLIKFIIVLIIKFIQIIKKQRVLTNCKTDAFCNFLLGLAFLFKGYAHVRGFYFQILCPDNSFLKLIFVKISVYYSFEILIYKKFIFYFNFA